MWCILLWGCPVAIDSGSADPHGDGSAETGCAPGDAVLWYPDTDGDGSGVQGTLTAACLQPNGYAASSDDCDDADSAIHPGAPDDACDGIDHDCDGEVDEDAAGASDWYLDRDGDGAGTPAVTTRSCEPPAGYVADGSDCDDGDPGRPRDETGCEGWSREQDVRWAGIGTGNRFDATSAVLRGRRDVDGDGRADLLVALPAMASPEGDQRLLAVFTSASAGHNDLASATFGPVTWPADGADFDDDPEWAPDWDGDGLPELTVVATESAAETCLQSVLPGVAAGWSPAVCWQGTAFSADPDVDGGEPGWLALGHEVGIQVIPVGEAGGPIVSAGTTVTTPGSSPYRFRPSEAGDVDGDGVDDLYAAAAMDRQHPEFGAVYLLLGPFDADRNMADGEVALAGTAGTAVDYREALDAGDLDGDGRADLLLAPSDASEALLLYADPTGRVDLDDVTGSLSTDRCAESWGSMDVESTGDRTGDGRAELFVHGATCTISQEQDGVLFGFSGPLVGSRSLESADLVVVGDDPFDNFATEVAGVGDWNGDGSPDVAVVTDAVYTDAAGDRIVLIEAQFAD